MPRLCSTAGLRVIRGGKGWWAGHFPSTRLLDGDANQIERTPGAEQLLQALPVAFNRPWAAVDDCCHLPVVLALNDEIEDAAEPRRGDP